MQELLAVLVYLIFGAIIFMIGYTIGKHNEYKQWKRRYSWLKILSDITLHANRKFIEDYRDLCREYEKVMKGDK